METAKPPRRRKVTLIEILAAVVINCVLAMMFYPAFSSKRIFAGARQTACLSSEKQLGLALLQYGQDNDERLPAGTETTPGLGWVGQIYSFLPYTKYVALFRCPEDKYPGETPTTATVSYAYNSNIPTWFTNKKRRAGSLLDPARSVMLFEVSGDEVQTTSDASGQSIAPDEGAANGARTFSAAGDGTAGDLHSTLTGPDPIHYATGDLGGRPRSTPDQFSAEGRHRGQSNFLFADGHAKSLGPEQVSTGADAPTPAAAQTGTTTGTAAGTGNGAFVGTFSLR